MIDTVIGSMLIAGAGIWMAVTVCLWATGTTEFGNWQGGGKVDFPSQIAICVFMASIGGGFLSLSPFLFIPGSIAFIFFYVSQRKANKNHQRDENQLRKINALIHPGIFDNTPPQSPTECNGDQLDLYDAGACTYIGIVNKSDIISVIAETSKMPDQGPNDIFIIHESLEMIPESDISHEFVKLINDALEHRDYLLLRWMPQKQSDNKHMHRSGGPCGS